MKDHSHPIGEKRDRGRELSKIQSKTGKSRLWLSSSGGNMPATTHSEEPGGHADKSEKP